MAFSFWVFFLLVTLLPEGFGEILAKIKHGYDLERTKLRQKGLKDAPPPPKDWGR